MARSNAVIEFTQDGTSLQFTVKGAGTLTLDLSTIHADVLERAAIHGLKQRISDAAAIPCDPVTGLPATPEEKFANMAKLVDHYNSGAAEWTVGRTGDGEPKQPGGITLKALAIVYDTTPDGMKVKIEKLAEKHGLTYKKMLAKLAGAEKVQDEIAKLRKPKAPAADVEEYLDELSKLG